MPQSIVPGLADWHMYAGGMAGGGKHSYDIETASGKFSISPFTDSRGRPRGYYLRVFPGQHGGHEELGTFRSPQKAVTAARRYAARSNPPSGWIPARAVRIVRRAGRAVAVQIKTGRQAVSRRKGKRGGKG